MKHHEREFFISVIRSGNVYVKTKNKRLCIKPLTYIQSIDSIDVYNESYDQALMDGLMTEEEAESVMISKGVWTSEDDERLEGLKKDMEKLKIEIYNNRKKPQMREAIRKYLRAGESSTFDLIQKKHAYYSNTCEGVATLDKSSWIIRNTTFDGSRLYDFSDYTVESIQAKWRESIFEENIIRELARNDPWKSLWNLKDKINIKLFYNEDDSEITDNQKNLSIWSLLYDNIQESMEPPPQDVVEDDDVLDGWFIVQNKKREQEKLEREFENKTSDKVKNAHEVFVMSSSKEEAEAVNSMNDIHNRNIKKQRQAKIKARGTVKQHQFEDEILQKRSEANNKFRDHMRGS